MDSITTVRHVMAELAKGACIEMTYAPRWQGDSPRNQYGLRRDGKLLTVSPALLVRTSRAANVVSERIDDKLIWRLKPTNPKGDEMNAVTAPEPTPHPYYTKIGADGAALPRDAAKWEAVLDSRTGLMWPKKPIKVKNGNEATVKAAAAKCKAGGFTDWQAPNIDQQETIRDRTRHSPAIDTEFFPDCPSDWFWTITPCAESPVDIAWRVYFGNGSSFRNLRSYDGFVRAVRVGQ